VVHCVNSAEFLQLMMMCCLRAVIVIVTSDMTQHTVLVLILMINVKKNFISFTNVKARNE